MIKLLTLLKEAKQAGVLYHVTHPSNAIKIINSNHLIGSYLEGVNPENQIKSKGISTTRDKNFFYDERNRQNTVQFVLDGNKISNNYKIIPYDYWGREYNIPEEPQTIDENEEIILVPKGYLELNKYLIQVNLFKEDKELIELLKSKNIKYVVI